MSAPLPVCLVWKAARGDEAAARILINQLAYNKWFGSYTQFGCRCDPPCTPCTQEQADTLNKRLKEINDAHPIGSRWEGEKAPPWPRKLVEAECDKCGAKPGEPHLYFCEKVQSEGF